MISEIILNDRVALDTYTMVVSVDNEIMKTFVPGQFAHIKIPHSDELLLRRPISINLMDYSSASMNLTYRVNGEGTKRLSRLNKRNKIDIIAPLGHGFRIEKQHKNIWLVGGGVGIAPLLSVSNVYTDKNFSAFLGYRDIEAIYQIDMFKSFCEHVFISTDDGSFGERMFVTDMVSRELKIQKPDLILTCGPVPMLLNLKKASAGIPTQVSMEQHMGCGTGLCAVCVVKIKGENKRVCVDGPVFDIEEVDF